MLIFTDRFFFSKQSYHNDIILEVCDHYGLQYQNPTWFFLQSNSNDPACIVRACNTNSTCSLGLLFYNHKRLLFTSKNKKGDAWKKYFRHRPNNLIDILSYSIKKGRHRKLTNKIRKNCGKSRNKVAKTPQKREVWGSSPHRHPLNAFCIFLSALFFDFWKSEKNGEKRRKPEKISGFLGCIFFDPSSWLRGWDLNLTTSGLWARRATELLYPAVLVPETGIEPVRYFRITGF